MVIEKIVPKESKGDDTQFACTVDGKVWTVSLHLDAAMIVSEEARCIYFSKGSNDTGWGVRIRHEKNNWKPITDRALTSFLDSLHYVCVRRDEEESAVSQNRKLEQLEENRRIEKVQVACFEAVEVTFGTPSATVPPEYLDSEQQNAALCPARR
jgi:hypothetical protein